MNQTPSIGDFVEVRGRRWLVEGTDELGGGLGAICLACIDDDASIAAFASMPRVHRNSLSEEGTATATAVGSIATGSPPEDEHEPTDEAVATETLQLDEDAITEAATYAGSAGATAIEFRSERDLVDDMLAIADQHRDRSDFRVNWLEDWIRANLAPNGGWNSRRLILFTERETTRRWLERRLHEVLADIDPEGHVATSEQREALKRAFNADPTVEPLRILICTNAAREGLNLQAHCRDLVHIDLPWNPSRLEQRNGRIDRKMQASPQVWCRYFVFEQREDTVLKALVEKTERIRSQLGSADQVIAQRIGERLASEGILGGRIIWNPITATAAMAARINRLRKFVMVCEHGPGRAARRRNAVDVHGVTRCA